MGDTEWHLSSVLPFERQHEDARVEPVLGRRTNQSVLVAGSIIMEVRVELGAQQVKLHLTEYQTSGGRDRLFVMPVYFKSHSGSLRSSVWHKYLV